MELYLYGQLAWMEVDDVEVIRTELPHPLLGDQFGVIAWSAREIRFTDARMLRQTPEAFVVMQIGTYDVRRPASGEHRGRARSRALPRSPRQTLLALVRA